MLKEFPTKTVEWRAITDARGREKRYRVVVYDLKSSCWRVKHGEGDWDERSRRQMERGRKARETRTANVRDRACRRDLREGSRAGAGELKALIDVDCTASLVGLKYTLDHTGDWTKTLD